MNIDCNELFFFWGGGQRAFPNKLEPAKGQDPVDWLVNEVKNKPAKYVKDLLIIGEVIDIDPTEGGLTIEYYDEPIPFWDDPDSED